MQETLHDTRQEFWRPTPEQLHANPLASVQVCEKCGADYVLGSRFCHVCGAGRGESTQNRSLTFKEKLTFITRVPDALNLPIASTVLLAVAVFCAIAGIVVGFIYSATTLVDWQAVQIWRIEWMLGSVIGLLAALLLKNSGRANRAS